MYRSERTDHAASLLWGPVSTALQQMERADKERTEEIRLHIGQPLAVYQGRKILYVCENGSLSGNPEEGLKVTQHHLEECFRKLCGYAVHSHEEEIAQGFVAVQGGHRAGLGGTGFVRANGSRGMRDVTSICLRVSRQVCGCAEPIIKLINEQDIGGILVAGPPGSGKTTILRDIARQLSLQGEKVAVVDERGEISAVYGLQIENDLGPNCDVIAGVEKGQGIMMAVRCLSPQYIICDEIGRQEEVEAVSAGLCSGVITITSIHAGDFQQLKKKPQFHLLRQSGAFDYVVMLSGPGEAFEIKEVDKL